MAVTEPQSALDLGLSRRRGWLDSGSPTADLIKDLLSDRVAMFGVAVVTLILLMAIFAPLVAPFDPAAQDISRRLMPPFWDAKGSFTHILGTDQLGRDILSRIIFGSRVSLMVGFFVVLVAGGFGVVMGMISGYYGGNIDNVIMRFVDIQVAFPGLLLALTILAVVGPSVQNVIIVLSINGWMVYARVMRGVVLSLRETLFVEAAQLLGCSDRRIVFLHIVPNLASPLLTLGTLEFARIVLAEAALSFLGMGIQPPDASWGLMLSEGHDYLSTAWWLVTFPGIAIALTVLALNLVASWLRTAADPFQRDKRAAGTATQ